MQSAADRRAQREREYQDRKTAMAEKAADAAFADYASKVAAVERELLDLSRSLKDLKAKSHRLPPTSNPEHLKLQKRAEVLSRALRRGVMHD